MRKIPLPIKQRLWKTIVPYSLVNIGVDTVQIILALFLGTVLTTISNNSVHDISVYSIEFIMILVFVSFVAPYLIYKIKSYLLRSLNYCTTEAFKKFQEKPLNETEKYSSSEWEYKIERVFVIYCWRYIDFFTFLIYISIFLILFILLAFQLNVVYFALMIFVASLEFIIILIYSNRSSALKKISIEQETALNNYEIQGLNNSFFLNFNGIEENYCQTYVDSLTNLRKSFSLKNTLLNNGYEAIHEKYTIFSKVILFLTGIILFENNMIGFGLIATMLMMYDLVLTVFTKIKTVSDSYHYIKTMSSLVDELFTTNSETSEEGLSDSISTLEYINLSYQYNNHNVFNDLSIKVNLGDKILISGANGSGKSTLMKILNGLYQDYRGKILVNERPLSKNTHFCLNYAYAEANPITIVDTVENNILLGKQLNPTYNQIKQQFGLDISDDQIVSLGGKNVSGGEAQKISLIRNIIANKQILFLDEPTNNLDVESIHFLINHVFKNPQITVIYISHDKSLEKYANQIIRL